VSGLVHFGEYFQVLGLRCWVEGIGLEEVGRFFEEVGE
jgi:hypothetical protein